MRRRLWAACDHIQLYTGGSPSASESSYQPTMQVARAHDRRYEDHDHSYDHRSQDSFTHVSYERAGGTRRSGNDTPTFCGSCSGAAIGILLLIASTGLLWMNEADAVRAQASISEARLALQSSDYTLIHVSGKLKAEPDVKLLDPDFGVTAHGMLLERSVEVFQWHEKETKRSRKVSDGRGGELKEVKTTYDYHAAWSAREISSSRFHHPQDHRNPSFEEAAGAASRIARVPFGARRWRTDSVSVDALLLGQELRSKAERSTRLEFDPHPVAEKLHAAASEGIVQGGYVYSREKCVVQPTVGCVRITWSYAPLASVSILAKHKQSSRTLVPWPSATPGYKIALLEFGDHEPEDMLTTAASEQSLWTWLKRGGGVLLTFAGWTLLFGPAQYLVSWIPLLSGLAGCVLSLVAFAVALAHSLSVIAIAWLVQRPLLASAVLVCAVASLVMGGQRLQAWQATRQRAGRGQGSSSTPMSSNFRKVD